MPRYYVKKTSGPKYTKDDLQKAILEVENGNSIYSASKINGVPEQTLRRWIHKRPSHQGQGRSTFLTVAEERCIVEALQFVAKCGFPFDRKDVLNVVETYLMTNKEAKKLFPNGKPGIEWMRGFENRWKNELAKRKPELLTKARASDLNLEATTTFFNTYEELLHDNGLLNEPERIYNLDEAGLSTNPRSSKIFIPKSQRIAYLKSADCGKAVYTVLFCVSATGIYLPPFVVYKGQHLYQSWTAGGPPGTLYGCSKSGWMQDNLFESWMKHFTDFVKDKKKPVLLLYDGHGSHLTYASAKQAMDNGIIILCLPPNSSHALQPLDVGVFSPMKKEWKEILKNWYRESRLQNISKTSFPFLLKKLFEKLKPTNAISGFKGAGLYPLNKNAIQHRILLTEMNKEYVNKDTSSNVMSSEAICLDSPLKDLKKAILQTLSPSPSANTMLAIANSKRKRKRVQSKCGEILTHETALKRLAMEENHRKIKMNQAKELKKEKRIKPKDAEEYKNEPLDIEEEKEPNKAEEKEIKQGSWVEVQYHSKNQSTKFIGQVIDVNEFYHVKYLKKSKLGSYYSFPDIDDEDYVQLKDICGVISEPKFDSRGHYFFNLMS